MDARTTDLDVSTIDIDGQLLRVAIKHGPDDRPPLLMFNGIGANWELAKPFFSALNDTRAIIFDVPGVGGSPTPLLPYRPSALALLSRKLIGRLGHQQVDVIGVSWGGSLAQQFAHQYPTVCRKLILAATAAGATMVPGRPSVLWKLATPRRYFDKQHMKAVAPKIYGGDLRRDADLVAEHIRRDANNRGYYYQLLAIAGWTSLPWLWTIRQPTLVLAGSDDPIVPAINGRILATLLPNARLEIVDDGHLFMLTRPQQMAATIESFLAE
ncbi:MAG: poly(3-hydroxyalkanoate) depolymerase [Burkholderiaceae bacterium]